MGIRCCEGCVPPKRYPGCHGSCPDYIKEKKKHEDDRERRLKTRQGKCEAYAVILRGMLRKRRR